MPLVCLLDNGAGKIKAGKCKSSGDGDLLQFKHSNCTARVAKSMNNFIADEVDSYSNGSLLQYSRPFDRGYLVNWQCESEIWTKLFGKTGVNITPSESSLCVTEAPFSPEPLQNDMNEIVFEEYRFEEYLRKPAAWFSAYELSNNPPEGVLNPSCSTIVDSGFSFTHTMPFLDGKCQKHACRRVNIGGKVLTNYLKEVVSYRQWNMMDEFKIMDQVKEELCYISKEFPKELSESKKKKQSSQIIDFNGLNLKRYFVLPDYGSIMRGFVKEDDKEDSAQQILTMETERFSVPEVLFNPSDVGINQAGIAEATWHSLQCLDQLEMGLAAGNIVLTGGNVQFPQFEERFFNEIRSLVPDIFPIKTYAPNNPDTYAFKGMANFIKQEMKDNTLSDRMLSRKDYLEYGHYFCNKKFFNSW